MTETITAFPPIDVAETDPAADTQFYSVTTILNALRSSALEYWAIKETATAAIESCATWTAMLEDQGQAETVKWLCGARWRRPKLTLGADQLGTVVHKVCEQYALTGVKPDKSWCADLVAAHAAPTVDVDAELHTVGLMLQQFDRWLDRFQPQYLAAEMAVYSERYGYAGTLDSIATIDGVTLVTDVKTRRQPLDSKGRPQRPYGETALQISAYRHCDIAAAWRARRFEKGFRRFYLLNDEERALASKMPEVDGGLCVLITPQSCEGFVMRCDTEIFEAFLHVFEAWRWLEETSKRVVGDPLIAAEKEAS
jgi:hypothetical protein